MLGLPLRRIASKKPASHPFVTISASGEADDLRTRMAEHGHLFFPKLIPRDVVLEARAEALSLCREAGWIDAQAGPLAARWSGCEPVNDDNAEWPTFYKRWIAASAFNSLPEHPAIIEVAESLLAGSVLLHPRKIGRVTFPQNEGQQTPLHQDFFHVHGTAETYTAWVPLGDCPQELGSLMVADESHKEGFREHAPSTGTGGWSVEAGGDVLWRSQDFAAGDVLFFHSLTMHQALPNRTRDELRLSVDNRYQRVGDAIDPAALRPHM